MTEWALPPDEQPAFHEALEAAAKAGAPAARYLRGGTWRNFQARYREIDDLHKQMLRTSAKVDAMPPGPPRERALEHLHRGQSNDCYWHGLFGGIYIVHMRLATLAELIAAEDLADEGFADGRDQPAAWTIGDVDLDGRPDALGTTAGQTVVVDLAAGAGIGAWDLRASRLAALSVMRRRPEAYHARLRQVIETGQTAPRPPREPAVISIHDAEAPPDPSLAGLLRYDRHERRGGLVRILSVGTALDELRAATERELGDFVVGAFRLEGKASRESVLQAVRIGSVEGSGGLEVRKRFTLDGGRLDPSLRLEVTASNIGGRRIEADLALEWGFNLAGGGGNPAAWYQLASGERLPHDGTGEIHETDRVAFGNEDLGVRIAVRLEPAGRVGWYPIETVSNSEAGPEKAYQGSCLLARWPLRLAPGDALAVRFGLRAEQTIDRRAEERGEDRDAGESPA
jgi:alpha-amylase